MDFVRQCLTWEPDKRLTPEAALWHPWICKGNNATNNAAIVPSRNSSKPKKPRDASNKNHASIGTGQVIKSGGETLNDKLSQLKLKLMQFAVHKIPESKESSAKKLSSFNKTANMHQVIVSRNNASLEEFENDLSTNK